MMSLCAEGEGGLAPTVVLFILSFSLSPDTPGSRGGDVDKERESKEGVPSSPSS